MKNNHGNLAYKKGCRCEICKRENSAYQKEVRLGLRRRRPKQCGTITMYNTGCRCNDCKKVKAEISKINHAKRKEIMNDLPRPANPKTNA